MTDAKTKTPEISFEFFPPQTLEASFRLWDTVHALAPMEPRFVSVTYGAGGTTRALTHDAVTTLQRNSGLRVAAHLTCVAATKAETLEIAEQYSDAGITDIVALRGDPPEGMDAFEATEGGFGSSIELIEALAKTGKFILRVGAYPEVHPEAENLQASVEWLKRKFDAGADEALTQFFFEAESFLRFRDACAKAGLDTNRLTPGILPIENWSGARRFALRCGAQIPVWLEEAFSKAERDGRSDLLATALCSELCTDLLEEGVNRLHFYTLNRPELTRDVCNALGIAPKARLQNVA